MSKNVASGELFLDLMFRYLRTIYNFVSLLIVIEYFFQYYIFVNSYGPITKPCSRWADFGLFENFICVYHYQIFGARELLLDLSFITLFSWKDIV